ncbi:protein regulator of cytokinesis 1-like isoform X1 [Diorhabda sublineata]|uniref:protein regulator of cytokinesis 1-like isoform X1 n=2 Tax=Diorhabda sublineata TaxID=1163346 RepID=UPI0024E07D11|nr:protein regulator of cytokinesis 1-like isoform X1 [Diorhabda sublineata]
MDTSSVSTRENLKDLDIDFIKDIGWASVMWESLQKCMKKSFLNWVDTVVTMSQNEDDIKEWKTTFLEQFEERCIELVVDIRELHEQVLLNIEKYLERIQVLCKLLQIDMPVIGQQKLGLYQEQFQLKKQIKLLEQMSESRLLLFNPLHAKQLELCKNLGKEPKFIVKNSLPTVEDIEDLEKYIDELEQESFKRLETFTSIKGELEQIVSQLKYTPSTYFENAVLNGSENDFALTEDNMESLYAFYNSMKKELDNVKEEIDLLWNKIENIWTLLEIDFVERERFRKKYVEISKETLEALRQEMRRCENLKMANIKIFVERVRQELQQIWKQCHCSESVLSDFRYIYCDTYTEDLLELHEEELKKWTAYLEKNKETITLINKHRRLWDKLTELEINSINPDRFNNRGGKLLKEEKERNLLFKQVSKIETNLINLAETYERKYKVPFLTYGRTIKEYIDDRHANKENAKLMFKSAMKLQKGTSMNMPSVQRTTSTLKRNMAEFPSTNPKKLKVVSHKALTEPKSSRCQLKIPKILVTSISSTKRWSAERKKRIEKIRRISGQKEMRDTSSYIEFQNDLSNRKDLRSTLDGLGGSDE